MSTNPDFPPKTVLLFSRDAQKHVCTTIRTVAPLRALGWTVIHGPVPHQADSTVDLGPFGNVDFVVIQRDWPVNRVAYQQVIEWACQQNKPIIYELDDLLTALPTSHPDYNRYRECRPHIALALADANVVTCSTPTLVSAIGEFASKVHVLPNYLPDHIWGPVLVGPRPETKPSQPLRIGYCGGNAHGADVQMIESVLVDLLDEFTGDVHLWFWGMRPSDEMLAREDVFWEPVAIGDYAEFVEYFGTQHADIFIAPLENTLFNRCKSGLKFLEYSALGVPGVYSQLDPYQELVTHGENGFLAADLPEWGDYLRRLIVDPELRLRMGRAAKATVANHHMLQGQAVRWQRVYADLVDQIADEQRHRDSAHIATLTAWYDEISDELAASMQQHTKKDATILTLTEELEQTRAENAEIYRQVHELRQSLDSAQHQLNIVHGSLGWQMLQSVTPLRYRLIPGGSRREQAIQSAVSRFQALNRDGIRGFMRKPAIQVQNDGILQNHHQDVYGHSFHIEICDDNSGIKPSVSVVITMDNSAAASDFAPILEQWRTTQSITTEILVWDPDNKQAWNAEHSDATWFCENLPSLIETATGSYICLASTGVTEERATLVEENLSALMSEGLAFTLNVQSNPLPLESLIRKQMIPASVHPPIGPSFVHRSCFDKSGRIDLTEWLKMSGKTGRSACVGKVIVHTTEKADTTLRIDKKNTPHLIELAQPRLHQMGRYLYSTSHGSTIAEQEVPTHSLHLIDQVLPVKPFPSEKPTVLMVMPFLAVGGAEQVHLYMAEQLRNDIRLVIVALEPHTHGVGTSADQFRRYTPYVFTTDDFIIYPLMYSWITYLIKRFQPDTLYIANGTNWIYDALSSLKNEYPEMHVAGQVYDAKAGWINRYDPAIMKNMDVHIGTNQHIVAEFIRRGAKPEQVHLIEHCVDVNTFAPDRFSKDEIESLREKIGIPTGNRVVTFMARLHQQKRPIDFVELARRCASDESITFLMVGNGPLQDAVDKEIARTGLSNIVRLPFHKPSNEIFALTDVYVLPSEYEGMPLVILEAQAMGIPVVVTDVGNNKEVIGTTGGGIVVDSIGNVNELRNGVLSMLASPPSPAQVRMQTIEQLSQKFGILPEQMAAKYRIALLPRTGD